MIEGNLALPFETMVLGVQVTVERVDLTQRERRSTGGSSTFSADASFLLLFRRVSGCYGSKMGADNTGSIPQGGPSAAIWIMGPCSIKAIACSQGQAGPNAAAR